MIITHHGAGVPTKAGDIVLVHYAGLLTSGVKFDSSRDRNDPIAFKLGAGRVIKGWDEGVARLRVGDQAVLVIPPALGYGSRNVGNGLIPPESTLVFIVEIVDVKAKALSDELAKTLDEKGLDAMVAQFHELQQAGFGEMYAGESDLNGLGYQLMNKKKLQEAIAVFKLNVEAFPKSANVYDSLAEAYMTNGEKQLAIENYTKALSIDPNMESAKNNLKKLNEN
jgi:tetratricopeptide (TPR) repeat protein